MDSTVVPLGSEQPLHVQLGDDLKRRLDAGEWTAGERLPTELELAEQYRVSRATVRTSMKLLEAQGLTHTRHGAGTFVTPFGAAIRAGMQELRSISETIRSHGRTPSISYHQVRTVEADPRTAQTLEREVGSPILEVERAFHADGELVAFCYDRMPEDLFGAGFDVNSLEGSLFSALSDAGVRVGYSVTDISPVLDTSIGWGDERPPSGLYLLLEQLHFNHAGNPVLESKNYFVENRIQFTILRTT